MAAPGVISLDDLLAEATERSRAYDWAAAADLYKQVLGRLDRDRELIETGRIIELLAMAHFKVAFQSKSREEFKQKITPAVASYEQAVSHYERAGLEALGKRSKARALFASFCSKDEPGERESILEKCISLAEEAAQISEKQEDNRVHAEALRDLLKYFLEGFTFLLERTPARELFERATKVSETALREFQAIGRNEDLLEILYMTLLLHTGFGMASLESSLYRESAERTRALGRQLAHVSETIGTPYALCLTREVAGMIVGWMEGDHLKGLQLLEEAATSAESTKDSYLTGRVFARAVLACQWAGTAHNDAEQRRLLFEKGLDLAPRAIANLEVAFYSRWLEYTYGSYAECHTSIATRVETEVEKKMEHLRKGIEISRRGMAYGNFSSSFDSSHALSKGLYFLALLDGDSDEKIQVLREALSLREETVRRADVFYPHHFNRAVFRNYLALVKAELSHVEREVEAKVKLLREAVVDMQQCVDIYAGWATTPDAMVMLTIYEEWFGDILVQLHGLTGEAQSSGQAIKVYREAVAYLSKSGRTGPTGALWWKIAKAYNALDDHGAASDAFKRAAEGYRIGEKSVPGTSSVFDELGSYMEAWSLIEDARVQHAGEQYHEATEKYAKASGILKATRPWSHLSNHYTACSLLEEGEALSHQERNDEALDSFTGASQAFQEAKAELENKVRQIRLVSEKEEVEGWLDITVGRERYSLARAKLEEAKVLDMKGEEEASRSKYSSASEIFGQLYAIATSQQARRELETLMLFAAAWAKMKEAEATALPELYKEAANLFLKAEGVATRKRSRLLALGSSSICRALESGARFRRTQDTQLYAEIKKQLEIAADSYHEAGLKNAADWTRATQRMFDALAYLSNAETEMNSERKTKLYYLAQNHFELAAKLYGEAGFAKRRDDVLRHLVRAQEEKEVLLTPMAALAENPAMRPAPIAPASLVRDQPLGLERFEAATVVGNLTLHPKEVVVGSDLTIELEMANVGKTAATLVKLENVAPEGFEFDREKIPYRVQDSFIDMKGRRLEYLKSCEVKLPMKTLRKGFFELRPRVLFVDEKGSYRSYEFEPVSVTVRELGIGGWVRGGPK